MLKNFLYNGNIKLEQYCCIHHEKKTLEIYMPVFSIKMQNYVIVIIFTKSDKCISPKIRHTGNCKIEYLVK